MGNTYYAVTASRHTLIVFHRDANFELDYGRHKIAVNIVSFPNQQTRNASR